MGRIGNVLRAFRRLQSGKYFVDMLVSVSGKNKINAYHLQPPGEDSLPLPSDRAFVSPTKKGKSVIAGYMDTKNQGISQGGEVRRYGRNSAGAIVSQIYQKNDGTIYANNAQGSFTLNPDGSFVAANQEGGAIQMLANGDVMINGVLFPLAGGIIPDSVGIDMATNGGDINFGDFTTRTHIHVLDIPENKTLTPSV